MDIFRFINSRDIRYHLKKIDYQFNTCEAAWLVGCSLTATLRERFDAWEEIIAAMPDCAPPRPLTTAPQSSSFHALLREYMALLKKKLAWFCDGEGAVYQYELETASDHSFNNNGMYSDLFPDLESCRRDCVENWEEIENEDDDVLKGEKVCKGRIFKRCLRRPEDGKYEKKMEAAVNKQGELLSLDYDWGIEWGDHESELERLLDGMWLDFPTPFERGDILVELCKPWEPFVLDDMVSWDSRRMRESGFPPTIAEGRDAFRERLKKEGDDTDMNYYAWYSGGSSVLYNETGMNYMDLERYSAPLQGEYRVLQPVSCFLKDWVGKECMDIGMLCNACALIHQEEQCNDFQGGLGWYTAEALRDYGIPRERCKKD